MARKRDYRAEYRARAARAQTKGWASYGQKRYARERIRSIAKTATDRGLALHPDVADKSSKTWELLEQGWREIKQNGKMSPKTRAALQELHSEPEDYHPVARILKAAYPKGKRSKG